MGKLDGKVAFVTGGARGIGACITQLFVAEGAAVTIADLLEEEGSQLAAEQRAAGHRCLFLRTDVTDDQAMQTAIDRTAAEFDGLDIVVADAGWMRHPARTTTETTEADFDLTFAINAKGTWLAAKYALPHLKKRGGGSIVNIASVYGRLGVPGRVAYGGSKAAVASITRILAVEYGPAGIRVNSVSPGAIATPKLLEIHHAAGPNSEAAIREQCFPLRRLGRVDDVAKVVLFLASDDASWVTGHDLVVDGGLSVQSAEPLMFPPFRDLWRRAAEEA